tara:strand:- start:2978 stop:4144 length:1167 start_codon:yes stop_codon:yes gene_type:complete
MDSSLKLKNINTNYSRKERKITFPLIYEKPKPETYLGGGVFGKLYRMTCKNDKQEYAVKQIDIKEVQITLTLIKGRPTSKQQTLDFILNESINLAKLNHVNIVRYYSTTHFEKKVFISLELMKGGTLEDAIISKRFYNNPIQMAIVLAQIASGVSYLHDNNLLHRDIKANNILLSNDKKPIVKLGDFGMSYLLTENQYYQQTKKENGAGHMFYRSPESISGEKYGRADDNWAVGIISLELMSNLILSSCVSNKHFAQYANLNEYVDQITTDFCSAVNSENIVFSLFKKMSIAKVTKNLLNNKSLNRMTAKEMLIELNKNNNIVLTDWKSRIKSNSYTYKRPSSPNNTEMITTSLRPHSSCSAVRPTYHGRKFKISSMKNLPCQKPDTC